jgi:hypothetical protein
MLLGETVAVYSEIHTEYRYILWAEYRVCTSQETHYISNTKPNRLMLFGETFAVYCENHTEHTDTLFGQNAEFVTHRKHINFPYNAQPVNAVWGNSHCLLCVPHGTHIHTVWAQCRDCTSQETHYVSTTKPNRLDLFGKTIAVYFENHTEHTDTMCGQNAEIVPHRKHITSTLRNTPG